MPGADEIKIESESSPSSPHQSSVEKTKMCALRLDPPKKFVFEPKNWPMWNFERFRSASGLFPSRSSNRSPDLRDGI